MAEVKAVAWLVYGGEIFKDRAFVSEQNAMTSAHDRGDGASVGPLYDESALAALREEVERRSEEQEFVWRYLQKVSPWSESNDMLWSDEIMIGIDLLKQRAADAQSRADRMEAENARLRQALVWYADPEIYKPHPHVPAFDDRDLSFHARVALAEKEGGE